MATEQHTDVIVVGGGQAALSAAISAQESGARVILLEKAPEAERGGNTVFTDLTRFAYNGLDDLRTLIPHLTDEDAATLEVEEYGADRFYNDLMRVSGGRADPAYSEVIVNESYSFVKWLVGLGVKWDICWDKAVPGADGKTHTRGGLASRAAGGGEETSRILFNLAAKRGITILYETMATKLLVNEAGKVIGVKVKDKSGQHDINSKAVILTCGGFQASPEMRTKYLGPSWDLVKVRGTRYDTGDGLNMALQIGAAVAGQFSGCHAVQVMMEGPEFELRDYACAHGYTNGIVVNQVGNRFIDEGEDFNTYTYAKEGRAVLGQPQNIAFQIFDENKAMRSVLATYESMYKAVTPVVADTIGELACKLDINEEALVKTVSEFNASVQDVPFDPTVLDGKGTEGIAPPKSNWALRIDTPPYSAYPVTCGITFTFGGLKTNTKAQVIDTQGNPIPSLYAAGEMAGSYYFNYASGSGLMKGGVFGRIAGKNAASEPAG